MLRVGRVWVLVVVMAAQAYAQPSSSQPAPDPAPPSAALADPFADPAPAPAPPQPQAAPTVLPAAAEPPPAPADPEMIDPTQIPIDEPPALMPYPRALVERPLMLPRGGSEGSVAFGMGRETIEDYELLYGSLSLGARFSLGVVEPFVGAQFLPVHDDNLDYDVDVPFFQRFYVGAKLELAADTALGAEAVVGYVMSDQQRYSPSVFVQHKFRPSEKGAIQITGGVDYNYQNYMDLYGYAYVSHRVAAYGTSTFQLQMTPVVALEVRGSLMQAKYIGDNQPADSSPLYYSYGADVLISVSERVDLSPYFGASTFGTAHTAAGGLMLAMH